MLIFFFFFYGYRQQRKLMSNDVKEKINKLSKRIEFSDDLFCAVFKKLLSYDKQRL